MTKTTFLTFAALALIPFAATADESAKSIHELTVKDIAGKEVDLSQYKGKALLIVNVASECGATPQYENLQNVYREFKDKGLVVLGFPANNYGGQEPGTNEEIQKFCSSNYGVEFPMFAKVSADGEDQAPVFKYLTTAANPDKEGKIGWNFEKFLVGKDGKLLRRFSTDAEPDSPEVIEAIESALK